MVWICGKFPSLCCPQLLHTFWGAQDFTDFVVVWTASRSQSSPSCVLHMLYKYFCSSEQFVLHLDFLINQKGSPTENIFFPIFMVLKNTYQIFSLWKKRKPLKHPVFHALVWAVAPVVSSFCWGSFTKVLFIHLLSFPVFNFQACADLFRHLKHTLQPFSLILLPEL